jgi:hypothetical protein
MKNLISAAAMSVALAAPAAAEFRYDRKLEQAVMNIVAKKMGELRGGFDYDHEPRLVTPPDRIVTGSVGIENERMAARALRAEAPAARAVRKASRIITF